MLEELVAEELDHAARKPGRGVAERTEGAPIDAVPDVEKQVDVGGLGLAGFEAVEEVRHPEGTFAAGRALAAAFVLEELHVAPGGVHHAGGVVHHDHRAGARQRAGLLDRIEVQADVEMLGSQHHHRGAPGLKRLELAVLPDAAAVLLDQLTDRRTVLQLVVTRPVDMPAHAPDARSLSCRCPHRTEPVGAVDDDVRQVGHRLDVVYDRRLPVEAFDRREGRLEPRLAAIALERGQQGGLFAADVSARAPVQDDVDLVTLAEHVLAEVSRLTGLLDGGLQRLVLRQVLAADIDEGEVGPDRVAGDQDALEHLVRAFFDQITILEATRLALVGVADEVARIDALGQEAPLVSGREAGAPPAAEPALLDQLHELVGLHLERFLEAGVAAGAFVDRQLLEVFGVKVLGKDRLESHQAWVLFARGRAGAAAFSGFAPCGAGSVEAAG